MPLLSAMLGHAGPPSTFYYLHAAPELLGLAAQRLHAHQAGGPCANAGMGAGDAPLGSQEES